MNVYSTWPHQQFAGRNTVPERNGGDDQDRPAEHGAADRLHRCAGSARVDVQAGRRDDPDRQGLADVDVGDPEPVLARRRKRRLVVDHGRNNGPTAVTYDISTVEGLDAFPIATHVYPFGFGLGFAATHLTIDSLVLAVPAGGTASKSFTLTPNAALPAASLYGGWIVLTPRGGGQTLRVPFAGFKGDYQSVPALNAGACNYPALVQFQAGGEFACAGVTDFVRRDAGATYTLQGDDVPVVLLHLNHQVRWLRVEVLNADGGKVHPVFSEMQPLLEYLARNSTNASFFAFPWDGMRSHDSGNGTGDHRKAVPNGRYVLRFTVLKPLGDVNTAGHTESWTSPVITLARP